MINFKSSVCFSVDRTIKRSLIFIWLLFLISSKSSGQSPWESIAGEPENLVLDQGFREFAAGGLVLRLVDASQTMAGLITAGDGGFDFTPSDHLELRSKNNMYHTGDITMRLRTGDSGEWKRYSTAADRVPVEAISAGGNVLAASDLANTLPEDIPLRVRRYWETEEGTPVLRFELTNNGRLPVEIGSLGFPMVFNNILYGKSLDEAHASCVFFDPYIGMDAGYLQVSPLHGRGKVLLVVPHGNTSFEAWNPLLDDPTPRGVTFEGFHEWMVHSKAHAADEWSDAAPWNRPTSARLDPGESVSYGFRFILAESLRNLEQTLAENERPVAVGIPGYVLPEGSEYRLFVNYHERVLSVDVDPPGSLSVEEDDPAPNGWKRFNVTGKKWGRARLTLTYENGLRQSINYKVIKPEKDVVSDLGRFLTNEQWYENPADPFGRSPSVITFDYETMSPVLEDGRAWIGGLSDEGGAGSWLAAMMKQLLLPEKDELEKIRRFYHETLWGGIQYNEGEKKYGVRKSLFFYEPDEMPPGTYSNHINYNSWAAWSREEAESTVRSYNYPHVAAAHWVFYRLSRNHDGYIPEMSWDWYLENACRTAIAMVEQAPYYARFGQMEGTVFLMILLDLHREGMTDLAEELEAVMKERADLWESLSYPFGSEMPWDSTGQEEVYAWSKYFGYHDKALVTLDAILAYMPTVPHWGYNGSARRYWDFVYAGKLRRIERQIHHYGSALNATPVLSEYRENPDDLYLLRVGHAGAMGALANITREGFAPAAFHSFPSTLDIDGINGDYGPGFFGYSMNSATYVLDDREFGLLSFSGESSREGPVITVTPTSASRSRVYLGDMGLFLTLDAGQFSRVDYNKSDKSVTVFLEPATLNTQHARLRIEQPALREGVGTYKPSGSFHYEREAYVIPLEHRETKVELTHTVVSLPGPLDRQMVQDQDDMTWDDYRPIPGKEWADPDLVPERGFRIALVAVDFPDQPFVMTMPRYSDMFGNPQINPVKREEIPQFYSDFFFKPGEVNKGQTINGYWMEQSRGKFGITALDPYGPYEMPKNLWQYGLSEWGQNEYTPDGSVVNYRMEPDVDSMWLADAGDIKGDYDAVLRIYAGYDETGVWQEFGEMKFQTKDDIPPEWGNPNPDKPRWAPTRYVPWTSWKAAQMQWGLSSMRQGENSGTITHELGHHAFRIGDNNNNPYVEPYRRVGSGPWDMMDRGSFNGPGGPHMRWVVPPIAGAAMPAGLMLRNRMVIDFVSDGEVLTLSRDGLAQTGPVVASVTARAVEPLPGSFGGVVVRLDGEEPHDRTPPSDPAYDPLSPGVPEYNFYSMEVVQRIGYDSFCPDNGVLLAMNKDEEGRSGGPNSFNLFNWVIDANPGDINQVDFKRPDGTPVMRTIADYRQLNNALFHAGLNSGSEFEYIDYPNRLHFYIVDIDKNREGILSYKVGVRSLDGKRERARSFDLEAQSSLRVGGSAGKTIITLKNSDAPADYSPDIHPSGDVNQYLSNDIYRVTVETAGEGWEAVLMSEIVAAKAGQEVEIPVYINRSARADHSAVITLIVVSESDPSAGRTATVRVTK